MGRTGLAVELVQVVQVGVVGLISTETAEVEAGLYTDAKEGEPPFLRVVSNFGHYLTCVGGEVSRADQACLE